ncbi:putative aminoadipate reductase [Mycena epipterygia]|nr:putative aminoadipate reductase [Mycena epipterygia]
MSSTHPATSVPMLIPEAIAWNSKTHPTAPFYLYAGSESTNDVIAITHLEFGRATHRAAQILRPDREGRDGQVVALIAQSDTILLQAVVVGLITANLIPFPISSRNSAAAIVNMLRKTACHRLIATCLTLDTLLVGIKQEMNALDPDFHLTIEEIPLLAQIYPNLGVETQEDPFEPYPASAQPSIDDICLYLHSSGSTGFPKAIPETHRALVQWTTLAFFTDMRDYISTPFAVMPIPTFHLSGIYTQILQPVYGVVPVVVYPPTATSPDTLPIFPSPDNILEHSRKTGCKAMMTLPALVTGLSRSAEAVNFLKGLDVLAFSGGSLPQQLGKDLVDAGVKLRSFYAATEFGSISAVIPWEGDERDWEWVRFSDGVTLRWDPQGDGTFECQILTSEKHSVSVENLSDIRGYATSDLWVNHPEKHHLWKMVGRIDDVIVHTSGEKTVPGPIEDVVLSSPLIAGVLMFGWEREQAGILIEPIPILQVDGQNATEAVDLRHKLWPIIEEANQIAPAFSRIFKEMVIFTSTDKPLPRAAKRTVMRKAALALYAPEIDALYNAVGEKASVRDSIKPPAVWEVAPIQGWILELAADLSHFPQISTEVDIFHQGFDSLSATFLRLRILGAMRSSTDKCVKKAAAAVTQNLVYSHPTISQLSGFLAGLVSGVPNDMNVLDHKELIESLVIKYSSEFVAPVVLSGSMAEKLQVVLLTGSTGNLGSHILASLVKDERVMRIYAFNRPSATEGQTLAQRHSASFHDRDLDVTLLNSPKIHFIEGRSEQKYLGLDANLYDEVRNSVTTVIHNAWKLDFNMNLSSFEPHILGTRHLVELALSSPRAPKFVFNSSISSALGWNPANGPCPEEVLSEASIAGNNGYGQSKFVAEQILAKSGLRATSLRIGQVCGSSSTGAWATSDWVPILVKTSLTLGFLPVVAGLVSWVDFETVTATIMDVALASGAPDYPMLNLVHSRPVSWNSIMAALRQAISKRHPSTELTLVPFRAWFTALESTTSDCNPGIKLLDFFRSLSRSSETSVAESEFGAIDFSTEKIQALSSAVNNSEAIGVEHVDAWVRYWCSSGFI